MPLSREEAESWTRRRYKNVFRTDNGWTYLYQPLGSDEWLEAETHPIYKQAMHARMVSIAIDTFKLLMPNHPEPELLAYKYDYATQAKVLIAYMLSDAAKKPLA